MGRVKDDIMQEEESQEMAWWMVCLEKGWKCGYCGETPTREEGAPSFLPWVCGNCSYMLEND
jgi:hypothetical protein